MGSVLKYLAKGQIGVMVIFRNILKTHSHTHAEAPLVFKVGC